MYVRKSRSLNPKNRFMWEHSKTIQIIFYFISQRSYSLLNVSGEIPDGWVNGFQLVHHRTRKGDQKTM